MTTLEYKWVARVDEFDIYHSIAGDLSHSYEVVPAGANHSGYSFVSLQDAKKWIPKIKKLGFGSDELYKLHREYIMSHSFGYLKGAEAKRYAQDPSAYGDYAEKLRGKN